MDTLDTLGANTLKFFIVAIAFLMILGHVGLDIGPAVAGLGVVGIAVGFGAQSLIRDYLNGALILVENQFAKGDVIRVAGVSGTVEDFTLRRTTLRDLDGIVHTVPNGEIKVASNLTRVWSRINQDVTVAYGTDIDTAIAVVDEVGRADGRRSDLEAARPRGPARRARQALAESGVTLKVLGSVRAADQWSAAGDFRRRLLAAFKEHGIEMPGRAGRPGPDPHRAGELQPDLERRRGPTRTRWPTGRRRGQRSARAAIARGRVARYDAGASRHGSTRDPVSVEQPLPSPEIENLLAESRRFPPDAGVRGPGQRDGRACTRRPSADFEAFWAKRARERIDWSKPFDHDPRVGPAVREVVHRRRAQRRLQLRRPARRARPRRQGRLPLDRRARRHPDDHLRRPQARGQQGGQRAQGARRPDGRPRRHLHADDPRAADRDAGLRPDRRAAHRRLRRLLGRGPVGPDQRLRRQGPHHRRRRLPARQGGRAQAPRRRGAGRHADDRGHDRGQAPRSRRPHGPRPRPLVARSGGPPVRGLPARPGRVGAHALPALHLGNHGQAQGHPPYHRRLPPRDLVHPRGDLRRQARRRVLVRRRHRLGHRATATSSTARWPTPRPGSCTRAHRMRRPGIAGGRSSRTTRSRSCTARRPPSGRS